MEYSDVLKKWQSKRIMTVEDLDTELNNFRVLFAYHSNVIENPQTTIHNTREIFENGRVVNYTGDLRTLFELNNQKICYDYLKEKIIEKQPVTPEFIRELHRLLMNGCYDETRFQQGERPGEYKKHDYVVGEDIGVPFEDVAEEVDFLCREIEENDGKDVLTIAAYFHLNFEGIHAFADGNGRVGRTLLNYYLMIHDYPPAVIYEEDKEAYYMSLAIFDKSERIDGFIEFLKQETIKTWTRKTPRLSKGVQDFLL
ncbi:MAG: Fic family protein [Lachnospiraceae bacterium]